MTLPHENEVGGEAMKLATQMRAAIPVVETDRLILRAPQIDDFKIYAEISESDAGTFFLENANRTDGWFDFTNMIAAWTLQGFGLWSVTTKADDVIGFVLLGFEPGDHEPELGYIFHPKGHGQGYATEAAVAARSYAFETLGWTSIVSTIDKANDRSVKLAERLGAVRDLQAEAAHNDEIFVYRHTNPNMRGNQ